MAENKNSVAAVQTILAESVAGTDLDPNKKPEGDDELVDGDGNPLQMHIEDDDDAASAALAADPDPDADADPNADPDPDADPDGEPEGGESLTIAQLAEAIEVDPEYLYDIEIGMGEGKDPVKLGELKDQYQIAVADLTKANDKLAAQEGEMTNFQDLSAMGQGVSQEMVKAFANMDNIQTQYQATDWAALEKKDPGEAALLRQKFQEAFQQGQGLVQTAQQNMGKVKTENLKRAAGKMFEIIPEWNDEAIRKTDQDKMRTLMIGEGYDDNAVNSIADPRVMKMLRELSQLREYKATQEGAGKAALKQVRKAPKVLKGIGLKKTNAKQDAKKLVKAAHNAPVSKKRGAEVDAVKALLAASQAGGGR